MLFVEQEQNIILKKVRCFFSMKILFDGKIIGNKGTGKLITMNLDYQRGMMNETMSAG